MERLAMVVLLTGLLLAAPAFHLPARAEESPAPEEQAEPERENALRDMIRKSFKDLADVTGDIEFKADDVSTLLRLHRDLEAMMGTDDDFLDAMDQSLKDAYEYLVQSRAYISWADANKLDAERYARVTFRVRTTLMKQFFGEYLDGIVERQRRALEEAREDIPEDEYAEIAAELSAELDQLAAEYAEVKTELAKAPGSTEAEVELLTEHREALSRLFGIPLAEPKEADADEEADGAEPAPEGPSAED
jgi:hypothetical protein